MTQRRRTVDRLTRADMVNLRASRSGHPMHVAAVLRIDRAGGWLGHPLDLAVLRRVIDLRSRAVVRLRQRVRRAPPGLGRPYWVDDVAFEIGRHVDVMTAPAHCDAAGLFAIAENVVAHRLDHRHPLWKLVFVDGLEGDSVGLVVVLDHALADGLAGIAIMTALFDSGSNAAAQWEPAVPSGVGDLVVDLARGWRSALLAGWRYLRHPLKTVRSWREMRDALLTGGRAPVTSLNRPIGPQRTLRSVHADLKQVRGLAHAAGGTVNDAALGAVAIGLDRLLAGRGEAPPVLYASVPLALRRQASPGDLGNQTVGMRVPLPLGGGALSARIGRISRFTREHTSYRFDPAAVALFGMVWSGFVNPIGLWLANRQRLVNVFVTNVTGPTRPLFLLGSEVVDILPVPPTMGNVPIAVAVFSYAGRLTLSVNADPDAVPDLDAFVLGLQQALDARWAPSLDEPLEVTGRG